MKHLFFCLFMISSSAYAQNTTTVIIDGQNYTCTPSEEVTTYKYFCECDRAPGWTHLVYIKIDVNSGAQTIIDPSLKSFSGGGDEGSAECKEAVTTHSLCKGN